MFKKRENKIENIIEMQLLLAETYLDKEDYDTACKIYTSIDNKRNSPKAKYQLGLMAAIGKGMEQNYLKAALYFKQGFEQTEDEDFHTMLVKSSLDYLREDIIASSPEDLWKRGILFSKVIYPKMDCNGVAIEQLTKLLYFYSDRDEYENCVKILRCLSIYGKHSDSQNLLGVFYNRGVGLERNDLAALYWFDKSAKQGNEEAQNDAVRILNAYQKNLAHDKFAETIKRLVVWCKVGTEHIPKDKTGADFWMKLVA